MRFWPLVFALLLSQNIWANSTIEVCLAHGKRITDIELKVHDHSYKLTKNGQPWLNLSKGNVVEIKSSGNGIQVVYQGATHDVSSFVELKRNEWTASVKVIKSEGYNLKNRLYQDNLRFENRGGSLRIINTLFIENYVSGVVEAESGAQQNLEYYKVQAVICRTYALANLRRHEQEGFHLCDQVHCQVFKGKSRHSSDILKATSITKDLVLVDRNLKLVNTSFHSNCGGQTANSKDVWTYELSHLKSICDTFCAHQPHAYWEKTVSRTAWLNYFSDTFQVPVYQDSLLLKKILIYNPEGRDALFPVADTIKMKHIRDHWKLPSALFSVSSIQDSVTIRGNGFGHGVGLCQEGAMYMSSKGYSYDQILKYYYNEVQILPLHRVLK